MFKATVKSVVNGKNTGAFLLGEDFGSLDDAIEAAENASEALSEDASSKGQMAVSVIEVREYPAKDTTGALVYRDAEEAKAVIDDAFVTICNEDPEFEGTMSYMFDCLFNESFEDMAYLSEIARLLNDDDVNYLLSKYGDDEYFVCKDGELREVVHLNAEELREELDGFLYHSIVTEITPMFDGYSFKLGSGADKDGKYDTMVDIPEPGDESFHFYLMYEDDTTPWNLTEEEKNGVKEEVAAYLWNELEDVPFDEKDCLDSSDGKWMRFKNGTKKEDIWHWFEDTFGVSVGEFLYMEGREME